MQKINLLLILLFIGSLSFAQKTSIEVSGSIFDNTVWSADTVKITGDITLEAGINLTIEPGVVVEFQDNYDMLMLGQVVAVGQENDSIKFTALNHETGWGTINFTQDNTSTENDSTKFHYCIFEHSVTDGEYPYKGAVRVREFQYIEISNSCFRHNRIPEVWGQMEVNGSSLICVDSEMKIINNKFYDNVSPIIFDGINGDYDYPIFENNVVENNWNGTIFIRSGIDPIIRGNYIANNSNNYGYSGHFGSAINVEYASETLIENNIIYNNETTHFGAIYTHGDGTKIFNNIIVNNHSEKEGGAIYIWFCDDVNISNNLICNNTGEQGGGIYFETSNNCIVTNNHIANNSATQVAGALYCINSSPEFYNNIIYNNEAPDYDGSQIVLVDNGYQSDPDFINNDIEGGFEGIYLLIGNYDGTYEFNIDEIPQFINPTTGTGYEYNALNGDWTLQNSSECINGGVIDTTGLQIPELDLAQNPRIYGNRIDIGAYENQTQTLSKDVGLYDFQILKFCKPETILTPTVTVTNTGVEDITEPFDVTLAIGDFTDIYTINSLDVGQSVNIEDFEWTAIEGNYSVTVSINIPGDEIPENDIIESELDVVTFDYQVYAYLGLPYNSPLQPGIVTFDLMQPQELYQIAEQSTDNWITSSTWAEDNWYGTTSQGDFVRIDTITGERTIISNSWFYTGLAYNDNNQTMYAVNYDNAVYEVSYLYTLDITTGEWTIIHEIPDLYFTMLACSNDGTLYAVDGVDFNLYTINPETGTATQIGYLGYDAIYSQDLEYDKNQDKLFVAAFNFNENRGELREVNTETGNSTFIDIFEGGAELTAFAIPYPIEVPSKLPEIESDDNNFIIYPNPSHGRFTIGNLQGVKNFEGFEITDITGKVIQKSEFVIPNSQFVINEKGIYFIKIQTENQIFTEKIIVQ